MDGAIEKALATDRTIDITTTGRRSGRENRVEIWFHNVDGDVYITGMPGRRDWYANVRSEPTFTFHLKESVRADLPATAIAVTDEAERRALLGVITRRLDGALELEDWVQRSPLVRVDFGSSGPTVRARS